MKDGYYVLSFPAAGFDRDAEVCVRVLTEGPGRQTMMGPSIHRDVNAIPAHWVVTPLVQVDNIRLTAMRLLADATEEKHLELITARNILRDMIKEATP